MAYYPIQESEGPFTRLWSTVLKALNQSATSGREWACIVALMRFQDSPDGTLRMSSEKIAQETGLSEDSVRQAMKGLLKRRYLFSDGHELPVLIISKKSTRGNSTTYQHI